MRKEAQNTYNILKHDLRHFLLIIIQKFLYFPQWIDHSNQSYSLLVVATSKSNQQKQFLIKHFKNER